MVWVGYGTPAWCADAPRPDILHAVSNRGALTFLAAAPSDATAVHAFIARLTRQTARRLNVVVTWQPEGHEHIPGLLTADTTTAALRFLPNHTPPAPPSDPQQLR